MFTIVEIESKSATQRRFQILNALGRPMLARAATFDVAVATVTEFLTLNSFPVSQVEADRRNPDHNQSKG